MWARVADGLVVDTYPAPRGISVDGVNYPRNIFTLWPNAELAALGIYPLVIDPPAPEYTHEIETETLSFDAANSRVVAARTYHQLPEPVPQFVSKLQLIRALRLAGIKSNFKALLAGADADTQEDWDLAYKIARSDPLVAAFAASLEQTTEQTDAIFRRAAEL